MPGAHRPVKGTKRPERSQRFAPSPAWLGSLFDALLLETGGVRRLMFGCAAGFTNGQMFCGLFGPRLFVRLGPQERAALLALEGAEPFDPLGGRPMREYAVLPESTLEDEEAVLEWMRRSFSYARNLPPKTRRRRVMTSP